MSKRPPDVWPKLRERRLANRGMSLRARVDMSRTCFRKSPRDRWRAAVRAERDELDREFPCLYRRDYAD